MRKTKQLLFLVLTVVVALAMGSMPVFAADAPVYDAENGIFYANGTAITISENADGETEITWAGGSKSSLTIRLSLAVDSQEPAIPAAGSQ